MSNDEVRNIRQYLTEMYQAHELSADDYAALMEDTRKVLTSA